ncbi:hypothetical protein Glove_139g323 [Diversispora epigaea]|uniref:Protein kinase domain-containing protein n=1 Tax=Diversispora epigaea TaxID=1348612 RepID=A0A397IVS4_9GLOM|nr:hypothetical protein Glove_139g323 [Diversispora epigaea]
MNNIPIPDSLRKRVHELRREFPQILGEAQVIIDNTGAYLVTGSTVIEIDQPTNNEITTQYDDMLTMYAVDIFTALEEQDRVIDLDLDELLRIATDMHGTNGQRMNAYKNLGDYLQDAQLGIIGTPYARNFRNVTPDWIYKLPKSEFERFLQLCETMGTQLMEDLLEIGVGSQELPFEGGNVCGEKSKFHSGTGKIRHASQKQQTESSIVNNVITDLSELINWIPYSQFENIEYIAEGGFGIVYSAIWIKDWENEVKVALKNLHNSKDITDDFLKEVISHGITNSNDFILKCYGITKDPGTNNNIMVMEFAEDGSLHGDLMLNLDKINWQTKLERLYCIAAGIEQIHNNYLIHRDLHSGNILMGVNGILGSIRIADLGLCRNIDNSTNHVYGIMPYVAPEIFEDSSYSQASDVYSFGMLMWEFTSGHKPFGYTSHNSKLMYNIRGGLRPEITRDTPEVFSNLMKKCWDSNPVKRPNITEIKGQIYKWCWGEENRDQFIQAENLRKISVELKLLEEWEGNNYSNYHPEAIYRSRPLNSIIEQFKLMSIGRKESVEDIAYSDPIQADFEINDDEFDI